MVTITFKFIKQLTISRSFDWSLDKGYLFSYVTRGCDKMRSLYVIGISYRTANNYQSTRPAKIGGGKLLK